MSLNINQNVVFVEVASGSVATINSTRGFSVLADGGTCLVEQLDSNGSTTLSSLTLPDGKTIEVSADGGSLLNNIKITPNAGTSYVTALGGIVSVV